MTGRTIFSTEVAGGFGKEISVMVRAIGGRLCVVLGGAARELRPDNVQALIEALEQALKAAEEERTRTRAPISRTVTAVSGQGPRILIVAENWDFRRNVSRCLESVGHTVAAFDSFGEAFNARAEYMTEPKLILYQSSLKMSAVAFCQDWKWAMPEDKIVVFVDQKEDSTMERVQAAFRSGADEFVVMPYLPEVLRVNVGRLLEKMK